MTHVPYTLVHRYVSDPFTLRITVTGLTVPQVLAATWICGPLSKALSSGITVEDENGVAVLVVNVTKAETETLGAAWHPWQAAAGSNDPPVVAIGDLHLDPRQAPE